MRSSDESFADGIDELIYGDDVERDSALYTRIADAAFAIVRERLIYGSRKYRQDTMESLAGEHRRDHLPHGLRHAVKACLSEGWTRGDVLRQLQMAFTEWPDEAEEDHVGAAVTRMTLVSVRAEYTAQQPATGAETAREGECATAQEYEP